MQESWRWFGPNDPIPLMHVRQAGASGIVTALHDIPNGELWPEEAITERREMIEAAGLTWVVTESIPVHEDIKSGAPGWEHYADVWVENLRRLAAQGIRTICYNFMPVLDWTRTDLNFALPDGALALRFEFAAYAAFDLFILRRDGAESDYSSDELAAAEAWFAAADETARHALTQNIVAGLPGAEESYTLETLKARLAAYRGVDRAALRNNLAAFLDRVLPVAEAEGARLALHPDDPPLDLFGLPRVVSTMADLRWISELSNSPAHGFTLCTGSLGVRAENDLPALIGLLKDRIHFAHLRAVRRGPNAGDFLEDSHLSGDIDMVAIVRGLLDVERQSGLQIPMRPDHGHRILNDLTQDSTPGYPAIGRLRGLAELRGVAAALTAA